MGFLTLILGICEAMVRRWEILAAIGRGSEDLAVVKMCWFAARREAKGRREDILGGGGVTSRYEARNGGVVGRFGRELLGKLFA